MLETIDLWDKGIIQSVNKWHAPFPDYIMSWSSETKVWIPFYALLVFFLIKNYGWQTLYLLTAIALIITIADQFTSSFMKPYFERLRPCHSPSLSMLHLPSGCGGQYGFASSHAANTFALAMFMYLALYKVYKPIWLMFVWSGMVSFSRIYLAAHYLSDVIVGAIIGMLAALLVWMILKKLVRLRIRKVF